MQPQHEAHLAHLKETFTAELDAKYRAGQAEHGGNLWENERLLDEAINEVIDLYAYLRSEKDRRAREADGRFRALHGLAGRDL